MNKQKIRFYQACKWIGLFALARILTRSAPKILCYHGFELRDEASFRPRLFMAPTTFARRMELLHRLGYKVVSLEQAVEDLYAGKTQTDTVVITVDDGFYSFFSKALPVLRRYGFTATVYVTSYYVDNINPVFRLMVQYMFWRTKCQEVRLIDLHVSSDLLNLKDRAQTEMRMWQLINYGEGKCDEAGRLALCHQLAVCLEINLGDLIADHVMELMRPEQLRQLKAMGTDVGLHTHRHVFSPNDELAAKQEIKDNRESLGRIGVPIVEHFCYPSGEYVPAQQKWLDQLAVKSSTTCVRGINRAKTHRHQLHRFLDAEDVHDVEFEAALCGFSDILSKLKR